MLSPLCPWFPESCGPPGTESRRRKSWCPRPPAGRGGGRSREEPAVGCVLQPRALCPLSRFLPRAASCEGGTVCSHGDRNMAAPSLFPERGSVAGGWPPGQRRTRGAVSVRRDRSWRGSPARRAWGASAEGGPSDRVVPGARCPHTGFCAFASRSSCSDGLGLFVLFQSFPSVLIRLGLVWD